MARSSPSLHADPDGGYAILLDDDLHCGTPLQILRAAGTWLGGCYEIAHTPGGPRPVFYVALGRLDKPDIPGHALIRYLGRRP